MPEDWKRWRRRIFQPASRRIGLEDVRPYDLRASFVSLLVAEGRTVLDVAMQAGHGAETCLRHYARLFAEQDWDQRDSAEEQIEDARRRVRGGGDARGDDVRTERRRESDATPANSPAEPSSRRPDSNRGPLHYEGLKDENGRASDDTQTHEIPAKETDQQLRLWSG